MSAGGAVPAPLRRGACATHCAFFLPPPSLKPTPLAAKQVIIPTPRRQYTDDSQYLRAAASRISTATTSTAYQLWRGFANAAALAAFVVTPTGRLPVLGLRGL